MGALRIRDVRLDDAEAIAAIYRPIVEETSISFEETPPDVGEIGRRIARVTEVYPWLVAVDDEDTLGYAYCSRFRVRLAYRYSVEVTVYVAPRAHRRGAGRALYEALFSRRWQRDIGGLC